MSTLISCYNVLPTPVLADRNETIEEGSLCWVNLLARDRFRKKLRPIHLREGLMFARTRWPFDFEAVATKSEVARQISFKRPGVHGFATFLFDRAER